MEERKFKVGDRVRVTTSGNPCPKGTIGKVLRTDWCGATVEFEEHSERMHNGDGLGKPGHCWYLLARELELVEPTETEKPKFKVGDRVIVVSTKKFASSAVKGDIGVIVNVKGDRLMNPSFDYAVEFETERFAYHSCNGQAKCNNGYYVYEDMLELVKTKDNWKVVIIPDGDKTLGRLYENGKVIKSVETKKHPDDEYSVEEATKVIMERLFPEKKEVKPRFLEKFEKGKTYIFDYDTYKAAGGGSTRNGYAGRIDGKTVDVKGDRVGNIKYFDILPEWCKEVESVKPVEPKEPPFKVGDIVILNEEFCGVPYGAKGLVVGIDIDGDLVVNFKMKYPGTHTCSGYFKSIGEKPLSNQTGLYLRPSFVEKVN